MKTLLAFAATTITILAAHVAHAAEAMPVTRPTDGLMTSALGPVIVDIAAVKDVDTDLSVDRSLADDFAREALQEPADRPIARQLLVVRTSEGRPQIFWAVKLVGSHKIAYVHANGEQEGVTVIEDERQHPLPQTTAPSVGSR